MPGYRHPPVDSADSRRFGSLTQIHPRLASTWILPEQDAQLRSRVRPVRAEPADGVALPLTRATRRVESRLASRLASLHADAAITDSEGATSRFPPLRRHHGQDVV